MENIANLLTIDGAYINYKIEGAQEGPPLVLLHGGLGNHHDFDAILDYVSERFKLILIDFRGHGASTLGSSSLSYAQHQSDVEHVLRHLGITRYALLGFSDGGIVGYRLAAHHPDSVKCLVTIGAQWRLTSVDPARDILNSVTPDLWRSLFPENVEYYNALNPEADFSKLVDQVRACWLDQSEAGYPASRMADIQCPTLIIRGDHDFLLSLEEVLALKSMLNFEFSNIAFAEHAAHEERPSHAGPVIAEFLTQAHN
ncbi:alpha/beta fold hydrolase [Woodsholea maritima]|uniref:alpha/beta fold hydrolase n=1 Tax=Woodsholea maritima TaxID=240237 RepID=UPI0004777283|nr:alpha/beta hydrolase [Woodsholea maritima]